MKLKKWNLNPILEDSLDTKWCLQSLKNINLEAKFQNLDVLGSQTIHRLGVVCVGLGEVHLGHLSLGIVHLVLGTLHLESSATWIRLGPRS